MRAHNWIYLNALLPFAERDQNRGLGEFFRKFSALEQQSLGSIREYQWLRLQQILFHAYESTPFYRKRFDQYGIHPKDIKEPSDLRKLPVLTREDIRSNLADLCSRKYRMEDLRVASTGGTTDTPVMLYRNTEALAQKNAVQWQLNSWAGFLPGDKVFYLWGAQSDYPEQPSWKWRMYDQNVMRRIWAPTARLDDEIFERYRRQINEFKPRVIYAYPSPLALFCEFIRRTGGRVHSPKSIICTAETLQPDHRRLMQEVLQTDPFQHYGTRDFGMIAAECELHSGLHFHPSSAYVELAPVEGDSLESGLHELIVTDLFNLGMPMLRYRINDCAYPEVEPCSCGRSFLRVKELVGRTSEVIHLAGGVMLPGVAITGRILKVCPEIEKMQIIQETLTEFRLRYVPGPSFTKDTVDMLRKNIASFFPEGLSWSFEPVEQIERERSGKTRFCISKVAFDEHGEMAGGVPKSATSVETSGTISDSTTGVETGLR